MGPESLVILPLVNGILITSPFSLAEAPFRHTHAQISLPVQISLILQALTRSLLSP